jgi:Ohr subfamily peroxiredoxin
MAVPGTAHPRWRIVQSDPSSGQPDVASGLDLTLATPTALGGCGDAGCNPEQLIAAAFAASFLGAMKFVATQGGPSVPPDATVVATVGIGPYSPGGLGLDVRLDITLTGLAHNEAEVLVRKAQLICPYANAIRDNVSALLNVT